MVRSITCNMFHMGKFCRFFWCLAGSETVEFNRLPCPNKKMYGDEFFAIRFGYLWNTCIDMAIAIRSCSYCICNRYWQNHRSILPNFLLFAGFDTLEFNRLPWSNNKIDDDAVFDGRIRYRLTMFGMCILIRLSRLHNNHIAHEIAIQKISTGNWLGARNDLSCRTEV